MNRDLSNILGFFKTKLNSLCISENNRSYDEKEIEMLNQLERLMDVNKAFKIIKNKQVNITELIVSFKTDEIGENGLLFYNTQANIRNDYNLGYYEYEHLKTVFNRNK